MCSKTIKILSIAFITFAGLAVLSCQKEICLNEAQEELTEENHLAAFSKILSKAVYENEELRLFIKEYAASQFDCDYDVFYQYVKGKIVSNGKTFRDILSEYDTNDELTEIEVASPLLTILVPDWSWIGAFSIHDWDTSISEVSVGFSQNGNHHIIYLNGEYAATLEAEEIPEQPTLIVKENERMKIISATTKSGDFMYDFVDPAFNGNPSVETRGRAWYEDDIDFDYEPISDFVPASEIDNNLLNAYKEFGVGYSGTGCQRDYIYFGMTKSNTSEGIYNPYIRERFYRFKIDPRQYASISTLGDDDPKLSDSIKKKGRKNQLTKIVKVSLGIENESEKSYAENNKLVIQSTNESYDLGCAPVEYASRIIDSPASKTIDNVTVQGYNVRPVDFGAFSITLLPADIR